MSFVKNVVKGVVNTVKGALHGDMKSILAIGAMIVGVVCTPMLAGAMMSETGFLSATVGLTGNALKFAAFGLSGAMLGTATGLVTGQGLGGALKSGLLGGALSGTLAGLGVYDSSIADMAKNGTNIAQSVMDTIPGATGAAATAGTTAATGTLSTSGSDVARLVEDFPGISEVDAAAALDAAGGDAIGARALLNNNVYYDAAGNGIFNMGTSSITPEMSQKAMDLAYKEGLTYNEALTRVTADVTSATASGIGGVFDKISAGAAVENPTWGEVGKAVSSGDFAKAAGMAWNAPGTQAALVSGAGLYAASKLGAAADPAITGAMRDDDTYNKESYDVKMDAAKTLISDGKNVDPHRTGQEYQNDAVVRNAAAKNAALRQASGTGRRNAGLALSRQYDVEGSKNASSAYAQGWATGDKARSDRIATGASLVPEWKTQTTTALSVADRKDKDEAKYTDIFHHIWGNASSAKTA